MTDHKVSIRQEGSQVVLEINGIAVEIPWGKADAIASGLTQMARKAEARGFDSVWTTEFFHQHGFVRLAAVAAATERVQVRTSGV